MSRNYKGGFGNLSHQNLLLPEALEGSSDKIIQITVQTNE